MKYREFRDQEPELFECFFAFSNKQFEEGVKKAGIEEKKIFRGIGGLYGTSEGINKFMSFYDKQHDEIAAQCDPQDVYDDEFVNHECSYVGSDSEAIQIVISYFGKERARTVNRKYANTQIPE